MIFGEQYDISLWFILKVQNKYREKAVGFIKEIPEEFAENIRTIYKEKFINRNDGKERPESFYNVPSEIDPNIYYKFNIIDGNLYMYKIKKTNGVSKEVFSLILSPFDYRNIGKWKKPIEKSLGSIGIGNYPEISFNEVDYSLEETHFGYVVSHTHILWGDMIEMKFYKPVSIKNMPDEMFRFDPSKKRIKKLSLENDIEDK